MDASASPPIFDRSLDPTLVPGIYNYCDRRCHRCAFTARCLTYRDSRAELAASDEEAAARSTAVARSLSRSFEVMRHIANRLGIDIDPAPEDDAAVQVRLARDFDDPLVRRGREYARFTGGIVQALAPVLAERRDEQLTEAVARIDETCAVIAARILRAMSGASHEWCDLSDPQDDANGSAKVARLLIAEARRSWRVLMEAGRAAANGVPARLVAALDELDRGLAARFPNAMQFVRPGFDEDSRER